MARHFRNTGVDGIDRLTGDASEDRPRGLSNSSWDKLPACHFDSEPLIFLQRMPGWKPGPQGVTPLSLRAE
jgi:hypothetical protein